MRNKGRLEILACQDHICSQLDIGYSLTNIYNELRLKEKLSISYKSFYYQVIQKDLFNRKKKILNVQNKVGAKKRKYTITKPGKGYVEIKPNITSIQMLLDIGYDLKNIHKKLVNDGKLTITYQTFHYYIHNKQLADNSRHLRW
jgi:hypothetical protein